MTVLYTARTVHALSAAAPAVPEAPQPDGVLVSEGRVVAVGEADRLRARAQQTIDFGDAVMVPGLIDGHVHPLLGLAETVDSVDLTGLRSLDDVVRAIAEQRERVGGSAWLRGRGLDLAVFGAVPPSSARLGAAFESGPGFVLFADGHSAIASPQALALAGIDGPRRFASRSEIVVDASGAPTGYLVEGGATELVEAVLPVPAFAEYREQLRGLLLEMARTGLTGIDVMDCVDPTVELLRSLESDGELPLRVNLHPFVGPEDDSLDTVLALQGEHGRRWRVNGVKMLIDGTVDGGTAWLERPDAYGEGTESLWRDPIAFAETATALHRAGVNIAVHAIGDRGVHEVLALLDGLTRRYGAVARHRIEHVELLSEADVRIFGAARVAASMQPLHCTHFTAADGSDNWSKRLGDERAEQGFRWADIRAAGGTLALGSDWPVAPFDPRWTMADAQLRRRFDRDETGPMQPAQRLSALQALEGYTSHAARAAGEELFRGRIQRGYYADFTVFERDPLAVAPEEMGANPVLATVVGGERVE